MATWEHHHPDGAFTLMGVLSRSQVQALSLDAMCAPPPVVAGGHPASDAARRLMGAASSSTSSSSPGGGGRPPRAGQLPLIAAVRHVVRSEGLMSLWKGNMATVLHRIPYSAVNFATFEMVSGGI